MNSILTVLIIANIILIVLLLFLIAKIKEQRFYQEQQIKEAHKMEESMREEFRRNREDLANWQAKDAKSKPNRLAP